MKNTIPVINTVSDLKDNLQDLYIIETILVSHSDYEVFFDGIYNVLKACFEKKECRTYPVNFKFYIKDTEIFTVELRHFVINLILWYPFIEVNDIKFLNKNFIMDGTRIIADPEYDLDDWINYKVIMTLRNFNVKEKTINSAVGYVCAKLINISVDFSEIMNLGFSYFTFMNMYNKYPRIKEIMESTFDDSMQPRDIELTIDKYLKEEVDIYKNDPGNPIGLMFKANTGIKQKQFAEFTIAQGLKPTVDGNVITIPIENSTLIKGLDKPAYQYIDASAARKSLILNKTVMGTAGNFGKLVLQLVMTLSLSKKVNDCGTRHLVKINVSNKKFLNKLNKRFYKLENDKDADLYMIDARKDEDLVGKDIYLRSPVTCALGNCVCNRCFGGTAILNYDIADGIAGYESQTATQDIEQNVLSSKHLTTTKSEVLDFVQSFYSFFVLNAGEVFPNIDNNEEIDDIEDYAIYIDPSTIEKVDEMDIDSELNTYITGGKFNVVNLTTGEIKEIILNNSEKEIFISDDALELMKANNGYIKFKDIDDDTKIFQINILNDELTKPLYDMMKLFAKRKKDGDWTINDIVQKFLDLLVTSGIRGSGLSGEVIINRLIRSIDRPYERPDFTRKKLEPYKVVTVSYALENNASPTIGLATQYLKRQLLSDALVTTRTSTSYIDAYMKPTVSNLYDKFNEDEKPKHRPSIK